MKFKLGQYVRVLSGHYAGGIYKIVGLIEMGDDDGTPYQAYQIDTEDDVYAWYFDCHFNNRLDLALSFDADYTIDLPSAWECSRIADNYNDGWIPQQHSTYTVLSLMLSGF